MEVFTGDDAERRGAPSSLIRPMFSTPLAPVA
jgi:hypothetical protein